MTQFTANENPNLKMPTWKDLNNTATARLFATNDTFGNVPVQNYPGFMVDADYTMVNGSAWKPQVPSGFVRLFDNNFKYVDGNSGAVKPTLAQLSFNNTSSKGIIVVGNPSWPQQWESSIVNTQALSDLYDVYWTGSMSEWNKLVQKNNDAKQSMITYYWAPNALLSKLSPTPFTRVMLPEYSAECFSKANKDLSKVS